LGAGELICDPEAGEVRDDVESRVHENYFIARGIGFEKWSKERNEKAYPRKIMFRVDV
jgi:hypothetical protein